MASEIHDLSERYIVAMAALDPLTATSWGVAGHDHQVTDFSPAGAGARADLQRATLRELQVMTAGDDHERVAIEVMAERMTAALATYDSGEANRLLRVLWSPLTQTRAAFDLMPLDTAEDWATARERLAGVPDALAGFREMLQVGIDNGAMAARRQALACAEQCSTWSHLDTGFWASLGRRSPAGMATAEAAAAAAAYGEMGDWLRHTYAVTAPTHDPVGRERYQTWSTVMNGSVLDLEETYAWGWSELRRIEARMAEVGQLILPGGSLNEVFDHVEHDAAHCVDGVDEFQRWNQQLIDDTIAAMDGVHFDIADPIRRCEAMIAPPGGAAAMYYTGPSEDFGRPGRTWYPTLGKTRFPLWREVSICYHEGVPGHHLQIAQMRYQADTLTRFQRLASTTSGHVEGWALYAERLMQELGYLDDPFYELGQLSCQAMRSVRVIVDIGMHLELRIPVDEADHPGEVWTPELALPFVIERSRFPRDFMASEVDRYLGLPGQAISYKVGERVWLDGRDAARARHGEGFDLKEFHRAALELGSMGLDQLAGELARL